jgi:hypothetical protein
MYSLANEARTSLAARTALIAMVAVGLTVVQFHQTVDYGFDYDDYHFVRPYSAVEVLRTFGGVWDPSGIEVPFYRPFTICLYAARFALFGLNSEAYHLLSLGMFAAAALLVGVFTAQTFGRLWAGLLTVVMFVCHPAFPYSAVVWITNQMHLLELLVVMSALCWWFAVRRRSVAWWLPLLVFEGAALLIKEDGVMLLVVIVVLHLSRKYLVERDLPNVPVAFLAPSFLLLIALLAVRYSALQGMSGYRLPDVSRASTNVINGLLGVYRLLPATRPYQLVTSWFVTLLPIAAVLLWRRVSPATRFGIVAGVLISVLFDLPFVFVTKAEQLHMVATGAALVLGASAVALLEAVPGRALKGTAVLVLAGGITAMASVSRHISRDFEPFGPIVLDHDVIVRQWAAVPAEIRDYLANKALPGASGRLSPNPAVAIESVWFGLHPWETRPDGVPIRWMSGPSAVLYVRATARSLKIPFRHEHGAFRESVPVTIRADGRTLDETVVRDGVWHESVIALKPLSRLTASRMHRVRLSIPHAWIPAQVMRRSQDTRTLGLQLGVTEVH